MGRQNSKRSGMAAVLAVFLYPPAFAGTVPETAGEEGSCVSARGVYPVRYHSELQPIRINTLHAWGLQVQTAAGKPVSGAVIEIRGGMPQHDHGLPTRPQVNAGPGDGTYRIEGLRFHMPGEWEISLSISAAGETDTCVISLQL